ncbi:Sac2 family-domain-containing protein [Catenaria anguillulae PL171]|uniref:Sac2 family-domain-containing protein n=1 Tax=Catenaria anguillulae PL171 TaxID=765915 RepID=A0A1Y2H5B7_9FUNG|nr:Sac2 family-domain-containing protein [Catenaria anguillulae PL171]
MASLLEDDAIDVNQANEIKEAVEQGIDLQEFSSNLTSKLRTVEDALVQDYISKVPELQSLQSNIDACDSFLNSMTELLRGFQTDLGAVSQEIATLQSRSQVLKLGHTNRQSLQARLSEVVDSSVLPPELIQTLVEGDVNESFQEAVTSLDAKMAFVKKNKARHIRAFKDVGPELERLRNKVAEKAREFFLDKIRALRNANTNLQMHQANVLLRYKPLNEFLLQWHPEVAQEVRGHYVHVVARYHQALFERYTKTLSKFVPVNERNHLFGAMHEEGRDRIVGSAMAFFKAPLGASLGGSSSNPAAQSDPTSRFALGDRARFLRDVDAPVIMAQNVEESSKHPIEQVVRSLVRMLVDTLSTEYGFDSVFYLNRRTRLGSPAAIAQAVFVQVFEPSLKVVAASLAQCINGSTDVVGLALSTLVMRHHAQILEARGVSVASLMAFVSGLETQFVDRYAVVMGMHAESLRKLSDYGQPGALQLISRAYAELASAILSLELPTLNTSLRLLRGEVERLVQATADGQQDSKSRLALLISSYDAISSVLDANTNTHFAGATKPSDYDQEQQHWQRILHHRTMDYVDALLAPRFGFLIQFVEETEPRIPLDCVSPSAFEEISIKFGQSWRGAIGELAQGVHDEFSQSRQGPVVVQAVLAQVTMYWQRYHSLLEKRFPKGGAPFRSPPVGAQNVMVEVKKYRAVT